VPLPRCGGNRRAISFGPMEPPPSQSAARRATRRCCRSRWSNNPTGRRMPAPRSSLFSWTLAPPSTSSRRALRRRAVLAQECVAGTSLSRVGAGQPAGTHPELPRLGMGASSKKSAVGRAVPAEVAAQAPVCPRPGVLPASLGARVGALQSPAVTTLSLEIGLSATTRKSRRL
jgi:hypothetical protein